MALVPEYIPGFVPVFDDRLTDEDAHIMCGLRMFDGPDLSLNAYAVEHHQNQHARDFAIMSAFEVLGHRHTAWVCVDPAPSAN